MTHWEQLTGRTMQKKIITLLIPFLGFPLFAQETNPDKEKLLKELAENACQCIDSVDTYNRPKDEINEDVNECILKQTDVYMLSAQLMNAVDLNKAVEGENGNKEIKVELNLNRDSKVFKEYYYEIERYLMKNCPELKSKVASNDEHNKYSVSKNPEALRIYDEGIELMKKEKYEKAIKTFEKALAIDQKFAFAYDNIGLCYRKLGNFDKAIESYQKSIELDPDGLFPWQNMAVAYQYKKDYNKAVECYERLKEIDDSNPEVFYGLGQTYFVFLNENEKALDNMCKAYNLYIAQKSAYRTDAEKVINMIYVKMKEEGKEERFMEILEENDISPSDK
jgi:tetratricopeptide (TPR) repeat protein